MDVSLDTSTATARKDWNKLATQTSASPFLWPGWILAWWTSFGTGRLRIVSVSKNQPCSAEAVFVLAEQGRVLRSPTNWHTPSYGPVARTAAGAEEVFRAALHLAPRRLDVGFLDQEHARRLATVAATEGYRVLSRELLHSPYIDVDGDWEAYQKSLHKALRSELRRRWRRLREEGSVDLVVTTGEENLDDLLQDGFAIEAAGWKGQEGSAILSQSRTERFYRSIAHWAAGEGLLRLAFLRLNGRAIAFDLCLEDRSTHFLLKTGYVPAYRHYGPGKLLRERMIARAFDEGMRRYEFLGDAVAWKREWAEDVHTLMRVQAFHPGPAGTLDWLLHRYGRPLAKRALQAIGR